MNIEGAKKRLRECKNITGDYTLCTDEDMEAVDIARKALYILDDIERDLATIMEGDTRSFYTNQPTSDAQYYDGIYKALSVVKKYMEELEK